jgi:hypothetical protein
MLRSLRTSPGLVTFLVGRWGPLLVVAGCNAPGQMPVRHPAYHRSPAMHLYVVSCCEHVLASLAHG